MVFSSAPVYLDPSNYFQVQQQQNHPQQQVGTTCGIENSHLTTAPPPPPLTTRGGGSGLLKPNSIAEQARLANIPQPETGLKCPRCESTNTKFCYYNNYCLSQPRHFCKTCKRYWTRGGTLRSVPVGGGIRRNKRSKSRSNRSKYSSAISDQQRETGSSSTSTYTTTVSSNSCNNTDLMNHLPPQPQPQPQPQLPFLPSLQNLTSDFGNIGFNYFRDLESKIVTAGSDIVDNEFKVGEIGSGIVEQWRVQEQIQQFPFLANLEPSVGTGGQLYPNFQTSTENNIDQSSYLNVQLRSKLPMDSGVIRPASVKMEENNNEGLNLSRNLLGSLGNEQYWGSGSGRGNAWTDHFSSGFPSSSTP